MKFLLAEEINGYVTNEDAGNTSPTLLVDGSQNVLIDALKKVKIRSGYERLGAKATDLTDCRNAWNWENSSGKKLPHKFYDDELEVYLGTIDGYAVNAWKRVINGLTTTKQLRSVIRKDGTGGWWDDTEKIDLEVMVNGDDKMYEWNGAVAVVESVTANTITKKGTTTFAENRFYTTRDMTLVNVRTGTEFAYTGGTGTTTLTGVTGSPVTDGMIAGDVLVQKVITYTDKPADGYNNDFIYNFENQIIVGSETSNDIYVSNNDDIDDFTYSSPRVPGEGALLTLDAPCRGLAAVGKYFIVGAGKSGFFKSNYNELDIGGTLTETLTIEKIVTGVNQGFLTQEAIVPIGNELAFLTNEVALRIISDPEELRKGSINKAFSTPIKPDFDAETWEDSDSIPRAHGMWYKNMLIFTAPQESHMYILSFVEDANGKLNRFWNPPQILPVGPMALIDLEDGEGSKLYGFSNSTPEVYKLFEGKSDRVYDGIAARDKLPIHAIAKFAYNNYKNKGQLKNFDEYFVEGEITVNTNDLSMTLNYDYGGQTQSLEEIIDGSDEDILLGSVEYNSLGQQSLALNPLGGLLNPPSDARRFRVVFEEAKEDFFEIQPVFETNEADRYWAIIVHGANVKLSNRKPINIKK